MKRRDVIAGLLVAATMGRAHAQQTGKVYRIALVRPSATMAETSDHGDIPFYPAMFAELRRLGYVEGQNLVVERYSSGSRTEHYAEVARDVVASKPDLIFVAGEVLFAVKAATTTIPIVAASGDPIALGIVVNLARPGSNVTGVTGDIGMEIPAKRLELLKQAVPRVSRVGYLATRAYWEGAYGPPIREAAQRLGLSLIGPPLDGTIQEPELRRVFAAMAQAGADALIVSSELEILGSRRLIAELAEKGRLPAIYAFREFVELGGLMIYALDPADLGRHAASEIGQILRGTKPGEIPYYQATTFALIINLKTAKTLGLTIPPSLLAQANEVIE